MSEESEVLDEDLSDASLEKNAGVYQQLQG